MTRFPEVFFSYKVIRSDQYGCSLAIRKCSNDTFWPAEGEVPSVNSCSAFDQNVASLKMKRTHCTSIHLIYRVSCFSDSAYIKYLSAFFFSTI